MKAGGALSMPPNLPVRAISASKSVFSVLSTCKIVCVLRVACACLRVLACLRVCVRAHARARVCRGPVCVTQSGSERVCWCTHLLLPAWVVGLVLVVPPGHGNGSRHRANTERHCGARSQRRRRECGANRHEHREHREHPSSHESRRMETSRNARASAEFLPGWGVGQQERIFLVSK